MVGWLDTAVELMENGQQVELSFGYFKGTPPSAFLRLAVSDVAGTALRELHFVLVMAAELPYARLAPWYVYITQGLQLSLDYPNTTDGRIPE